MSTASALGLSPSEEAATAQFMSLVNEWRSVRGFEPVSSAAAVKFLMARKFRQVIQNEVTFSCILPLKQSCAVQPGHTCFIKFQIRWVVQVQDQL